MAVQTIGGFTNVYQQVIDETKRPDRQAIVNRRIARAILKYHRCDHFQKDLVEQDYNFEYPNTAVPTVQVVSGSNALFMNNFGVPNPTINVQVIKKADLIRFRSIKYIRKFRTVDAFGLALLDPTTGQQGTWQGGDLQERSPDSMTDGYGYDITDTWYESGENIMISTSTPLSTAKVGYFADPILDYVTPTNCVSWILDEYPELIVADVARAEFVAIGKDAEAKGMAGQLEEALTSLLVNNTNLGTAPAKG